MQFEFCFNQHKRYPTSFSIFTWLLLTFCSASIFSADAVSALGRLEPQHGVILVSAPLTPNSTSGAIVSQLMVERGQDVEQGQLLAVMETEALEKAHVAEAEAQHLLAVRHEASSRAAAEEACVSADVALRESERRAALLQKGVAGEEEADVAAGRAEALAAACTSARTAVHAAAADVELALAHIEVRQAQLARSYVLAPVAGRILDIHAWPGEMAALEGLLEMGQVGQMYAIAEVYETDINRIEKGQGASISSDALDSVLSGTVERIRPKVAKMDAIGTDPSARKDARIIEVEIKLEDSSLAASLTYLQVDIEINP
jgi:HlyD family secretion protein